MAHEGGSDALLPVQVVATWPVGSFAESVAVDADGVVHVSLHTDHAVVRVDPVSGEVTPFARFDRPATGLAFAADGALIVSGGTPGAAPGIVWRTERSGEIRQLAEIPDAAFLNGLTPLGDRMLIADSIGATIYAIHSASGAVETWLVDPLLGAGDGTRSPGANGIKIFDEVATISVTAAEQLVRVPIVDGRPGRIEVAAEHLRADDMAFDDQGSLYIATHRAQSLMRLDPDGARTTLARAGQGMIGSTAVAFGRTSADRHCIYVTTTGGTGTVPEAQRELAKLLRIDVGRAGQPLLGHGT